MDRQGSREKIEKLVAFFGENIYQLKSPNFNETQARQQLIDPFFEALGWDVRNRSMKPLFLQEVVPEGRVKTKIGREISEQPELFKPDDADPNYKEYKSILEYIAEDEYKASSREAIKKPDYRFRINGQTKFFVEAKKPFVDLSKNQGAIFQVKRYGFSGRVPVSILTDFEQFRVFDCTQRPEYSRPKIGIIKEFDLSYLHYPDKFEHLYDTFSRDAVEGGSVDSLVKKQMQKRTGDFELDRAFLDDLSKWREELARDIAKHPKNRRKLNDYTLNESVQRILDRIVFFRVCEDREIEVENTLLAILQMWKSRPGMSLYSLLTDLFKQRRALYNGLLFSPHECEDLEVGDDVLIKILQNLNYPFSPYHFNEIGVEIFGSIYEKFLGKTIHLTPKTTRIEEKPEVRKAGGVYYTPQYIVNYIVDNTLGKLLYDGPPATSHPDRVPRMRDESKDERGGVPRESKDERGVSQAGWKDEPSRILKLTPKQVSKLKIIDIACGSGSFLLGAFQKLIDYHLEWYTAHPKDIQTVQHVPDAYKDANGNLHLSARKKRDILVNNIYGVDIDRQAVEVTQMSLYLKVLEGESSETLNPQMTLALKEVYLPSLTSNIKCGNSLVSTDFMAQGELFDEEAQHIVNPFDWDTEFFDVLSNGGFDCIIGNPPWVSLTGKHRADYIPKTEIEYLEQRFHGNTYMPNLYEYFIAQSLGILKVGGFHSFIVPDRFAFNVQFQDLRKRILETTQIQSLYFKMPFPDIIADTMIYVVQKPKHVDLKAHLNVVEHDETTQIITQMSYLHSRGYTFQYSTNQPLAEIFDKIDKSEIAKPLAHFCDSTSGFGGKSSMITTSRMTLKQMPTLKGDSIGRYEVRDGYWFEFKKSNITGRTTDESKLGARPKLLIRKTGDSIIATYDDSGIYPEQSLYFLYNFRDGTDPKYILGILNSRLLNRYFRDRLITNKDSIAQIKKIHLDQLPIPIISFSDARDKMQHDDLVKLAGQMLNLRKGVQRKQFDSEREPIERQIAATDKKIDELVYELYGLTEEEIKMVEGK